MTTQAKIILSAEDRTKAAFASAKTGLGQVTSLAASAGFSLAALGSAASLAGLVSMVKQITDGVDQMNDLKDATGASIENISALESVARRTGHSMEVVGNTLIKFNMALGQTQKPGSEAEKVLKAIGLNAQALRDLDPAEALRQTAVALTRFADDGNKARAVQELFGRSLKEATPYLNDLAEAGDLVATVTAKQAEEADKFNKELAKMSSALTDVGRDLAGPVVSGMNTLIDKFSDARKEGEDLVTTLLKIGNFMVNPAAAVAAGIAAMVSPALGKVGLARAPKNGYTDARKEVEDITALLQSDTTLNANEIRALAAQRDRAKERLSGYLSSTAGGGRGMGGYEGVARGSLSLPPDEKKAKAVKATKELTEAEKDLAYHLEYSRKAVLERADAMTAANAQTLKEHAELAKARSEEWDQTLELAKAYEQTVAGLASQNAQMRDEIELIGLSEAAQVEVLRARNEAIILTKEQELATLALASVETGTMTRRQIALAEEIRLLRERGGLLGTRQLATEQARAAGDTLATWQRTNQQIGDSFIDNMMRGGKSAKQYLKDLFRTLVLQPMLAPVGGAFASMVSGPAAAQGAGGSLVGSAGSSALSYLTGGAGAAMTAGMTGASVAMAGGTTFGTVGAIGGYGAAMGVGGTGVAGAAGAVGAGATAALAAIPVAGWIALAALAVYSLAKGGEKRSGGQYLNGAFVGGPSGGEVGGEQVRASLAAVSQSVNDTLKQLGSSATMTALYSGLETSKHGKGFAYAGGQLSTGASFGQGADGLGYLNRRGSMSPEQATAAFGEELKQATLQALQAANVPGVLGEYLLQLGDIDKLTGGQLDAAMGRINSAIAQKLQLEDVLFDLTSTDLEKLARTRERERAAIDPFNAELLEQIYVQQDLKTAMEQSAEAAASLAEALIDATDAAWDALVRAADARRNTIESQRQVAQEQVGTLGELFAVLKTHVGQLYGEVTSTAGMGARQGSQFITQALAAARATGYLPESAALSEAAMAARGGISPAGFGNVKDYEFAKLVLAGQLKQLQDITEPQLSTAEQHLQAAEDQLVALDEMMRIDRDQLDAARGIDVSVLSVAEAVTRLHNAMFKETGKTPATAGASGAAGAGAFAMVGGGTGGGGAGSEAVGTIRWAEAQSYFREVGEWESGPARMAMYLQAYGETEASAAAGLGVDPALVRAYFERGGIPSFDVGTDYVPRDMLAQIHQGEQIVRRSDNLAAGGGGSAVERLLQSIDRRLQVLEANTEAGAIHGFNGAKGVREMLDRGVPIDQTRTGALRTAAA